MTIEMRIRVVTEGETWGPVCSDALCRLNSGGGRLHLDVAVDEASESGVVTIDISDEVLCQLLWLRLTGGGTERGTSLGDFLNCVEYGKQEKQEGKFQYLIPYSLLEEFIQPKPTDVYPAPESDTAVAVEEKMPEKNNPPIREEGELDTPDYPVG